MEYSTTGQSGRQENGSQRLRQTMSLTRMAIRLYMGLVGSLLNPQHNAKKIKMCDCAGLTVYEMKAGELKKIARSYGEFLPPPWRRIGKDYMRREGDWVQVVAFCASRWDDKYEPRTCFEFLKEPGEALCGYLGQGLVHDRTGAQRWVTLRETAHSVSAVFNDMSRQFKPSILAPLSLVEVKNLLRKQLDYWPNPYALSVMAAEAGDKVEAEGYFKAFSAEVANKPYEWAEKAKQELIICLREAGTEALRTRLAAIEAQKLRELKWK